MGHEGGKTERPATTPAATRAPAAGQAPAGGLLKSLRGMSYDAGRAALTPPEDPNVQITRPGDAIEQDADRRAAQHGPVSPDDLAGVRLHTGAEADHATTAMGAKALTQGQDVYLRGDVAPGTPQGDQVLAHEVAHTRQQGADHRVAGWWDDGHQAITRNVGKQMTDVISEEASDFVARKSGSIDRTYQSIITNFKQYLDLSGEMKEGFLGEMKQVQGQEFEKQQLAQLGQGPEQTPPQKVDEPTRKGGDKGKKAPNEKPSLEQAQKRWDRLDFHVRLPNEMPLHGEAGGYVSDGGVGRNKAAVEELVEQAATAYNSASGHGIGNYREGLNRLADAAHANEDRGSHGEGRPFTGHDPRLLMPTQPNGQPNPHYTPGWDCDDPSKNSGGRALAEGYAREVIANFVSKLTPQKRENLKAGKGGGQSRGIGFRNTIRVLGSHKAKKLEDRQSLVMSDEQYEEIKKKNPAPEELTSEAGANMEHLVSNGGMARDVIERLTVIRDEVTSTNVKTPEKTYQKYSRLATAAQALAFYAGRSDDPLKQKVAMEARYIAELATGWAGEVKTVKKKERAELSTRIMSRCSTNVFLLTSMAQAAWPDLVPPQGGGEHANEQQPDEQEAPKVLGDKPTTGTVEVLQPQPKQPQAPHETEQQKTARIIAERREQVRLEAILVLRELKAGVHGPAEIEKKYGHYSRLRKCVMDWNELVGLDKALKLEFFCTLEALKKINGWIQRSKGLRHGSSFKEDVLADVEWLLENVAGYQR